MVGPVQLDACGHVMSTTSLMQQRQAAIRKRVLQMVRDLYQIQPFWMGLKDIILLVSTSATLGTLGLGRLQMGEALSRATSVRQALLLLLEQ